MAQLDRDRLAEAYAACMAHLGGLGRWQRRKAVALGLVGSIAFRMFVVLGGLIAVLAWRGYLE
jgi:predicted tellurium resistance membrane protein TerC